MTLLYRHPYTAPATTFTLTEGRAFETDRARAFRVKRELRLELEDAAAEGDRRAALILADPCGCGDVVHEGAAVCVTCGAQIGCSEGCP